MDGILDWLLARAKEKTTWAGLIIVTMNFVGIQVGETQIENLALSIAGFVGAVLAATPEKKAE